MKANVTADFTATSATQNLGGAAADAALTANAGIDIDMSAAAVATAANDGFTLTGNTGDEVLKGSAGDDTIVGGAGDDTIVGGAGADTVKFADTAANNGADTITGFTTGSTTSTADVLDFSNFLSSGSTIEGTGSAGSGALAATTAGAASGGTNIANKIMVMDTDDTADVAALKTLIVDSTADNALYLADADNAVVLLGDVSATTAGDYSVYYVTGDSSTTADQETVTLVGTVSVDDLATIDVANFAG